MASPRFKKNLLTVIRIAIAVAGIGYVVWVVDWHDTDDAHGILTILRQADAKQLLLAALLIAPVYLIQAVRWWMLMHARGMTVSLSRAFRLVMVGAFFNFGLPGATGGDVVKAYYAAAKSDRRTDAVMSVIFDRIVGLLGLVLLAGVAGLFMLDHPVARTVTIYIWLGAAGIVVVSGIYFSKRLRQATGLEALFGKLPDHTIPAKIDQAAVAYRDHKTAVLVAMFMSVPVHVLTTFSMATSGFALGMDERMGVLLTVVPVVSLSGAIPISYQGMGVEEGLAGVLIVAASNQIVGMLMLRRLYQLIYAMLGGLFLLRGDIHLHPERFEAAEEAAAE